MVHIFSVPQVVLPNIGACAEHLFPPHVPPALRAKAFPGHHDPPQPFVQKRFLDTIRTAIDTHQCTDVVVVSCFNGTGGATFLQRLQDMYISYVDPATTDDPACNRALAERWPNVRVVGDEAWMHDERVVDWCADMAASCLRCRTGRAGWLVEVFLPLVDFLQLQLQISVFDDVVLFPTSLETFEDSCEIGFAEVGHVRSGVVAMTCPFEHALFLQARARPGAAAFPHVDRWPTGATSLGFFSVLPRTQRDVVIARASCLRCRTGRARWRSRLEVPWFFDLQLQKKRLRFRSFSH